MQGSTESWEISKENIQPLRSGRNVSCLKTAFQPTQKDLETLNKERQKFEEEILAGDNDDDPIDTWDRFLNWTLQNYPQGHGNDHYQNLMQKFVVKFIKYDKYQNDPRYVKVWINMAVLNENPINSFRYMMSKGIGKKCSCLYVAWAEEHEKYGRWKKANDIYELGVSNDAQPTDLLTKQKNAFEMRSARVAMLNMQNTDQEFTEHSEQPQRTKLGILEGKGKLKTVGTMRSANNPMQSLRQPQQQQIRIPVQIKHSQNKPIQIFNENEAAVSQNPAENVGTWSTMPNSKHLDKENDLMDPSVWRGAKVKQNSRKTPLAPKVTPSSKPVAFSIFQDKLPENSTAVPPSARKLYNTVDKQLAERKPRKEKVSSLHQRIAEQYGENTNDPSIVRVYPVEKIYSVMGEFSLEEIWATSWRKRKREEEQGRTEIVEEKEEEERRADEELDVAGDVLDEPEHETLISDFLSCKKEAALPDIDSPFNCDDVLPEFNPVPLFSGPENVTEIPISNENTSKSESWYNSLNRSKLAQPSPTINTKFARAEIEEMFKQDFQPVEMEDAIETDDINPITLQNKQSQPFPIFCDEIDDVPSKKSNFNIFCDVEPQSVKSLPHKSFVFSSEENEASEDSENIPTPGYKPGVKRTNLAGILQPAVGFELHSVSSSEEEDEEDIDGVYPLEPVFHDDIVYSQPLKDSIAESSGPHFENRQSFDAKRLDNNSNCNTNTL